MSELLLQLRNLTFGSMILRLCLAMLCGGVLGYGRSRQERPAGLRTYMLVCIAAASATLLALYEHEMLHGPWSFAGSDAVKKFDVARIVAQTISGIGFIGAGIIIKTSNHQVSGLTTAAGLWTTGIIGLAVGSGYYELAVIATILVLLAETVFFDVGRKIKHQPEYTLEVHYNSKTSLDNMLRYCKDNGMSIINLKIHSSDDASAETRYTAVISLRGTAEAEVLSNHVIQMPGIVSAAVL